MFHKISDLLPKLLKSKSLDTPIYAARVLAKYKLALAKLGLEELLSASKAFKIESGTLWIKTINNIYSQELSLRSSEIIESINKELGTKEVENLRFIIASLIEEHEEKQGD